VLHTTFDPRSGSVPIVRDRPGIEDLKRLGAWFDDPQTEASSHVANDAEGNDARYVRDSRKAWTQAAFNSVSLSIEQIAHWHRRWDIPIRRAEVSGSIVTRPGVATHDQLGSAGGGHHDPGKGYPVRYVLRLARSFAS